MKKPQTKYEQFQANELKSMVKNDPFEIMEAIYGAKYTNYRSQWLSAYERKEFNTEFPLHIDLDLQDSCNQKCRMCHQRYRERTQEVMPIDILDSIIDEGAENGLCALNFGSSGEPLLQKELLLHGIGYASARGIMDTFVHTNGVLLDESFSSRLLDSGLKNLCISLDAANEETYRRTRASKQFKLVVDNIQRFRQMRNLRNQSLPTIRVSFCVNPLNHSESEQFLHDWKEQVDLVEMQGYRHVHSSIDVQSTFHKTTHKCANPFRRIMIWPNADVTLCCGYRSTDVLLGNLNNSEGNKISQLWKSAKIDKIRTAFRDQKDLPKTCQTCLDSGYEPND